jgi:ubiquinone/menaquinone biosynthesis C-methylase UbiE
MMGHHQEKNLSLPWTGERYVPDIGGNIRLEHLHRYILARDLAKDKEVLDIASGEGYGTAMIAETAKWVAGVDISPEAVGHAQKAYNMKNLEFRIGSCVEIPYPDQSFDLIVSFETIEHHNQHEEMMVEFKRVLRPDGQIIISSPEKYEYSVAPNFTNSFHVKELYRHEFENLLKAYFSHVVILGQRVLYGSAIFSEDIEAQITTYDSQGNYLQPIKGLNHPLYLIAIVSDTNFSVMLGSVLEQDINASEPLLFIQDALIERDNQITALTQTLNERNGEITSINHVLIDRDSQIASLVQNIADRETQITSLSKDIADRETQITSLSKDIADRYCRSGNPDHQSEQGYCRSGNPDHQSEQGYCRSGWAGRRSHTDHCRT